MDAYRAMSRRAFIINSLYRINLPALFNFGINFAFLRKAIPCRLQTQETVIEHDAQRGKNFFCFLSSKNSQRLFKRKNFISDLPELFDRQFFYKHTYLPLANRIADKKSPLNFPALP